MKMIITVADQDYRVLDTRAHCIAIPLQFNGAQPSCFGVEPAQATPFKAGSFIGDITQGGSCNVMEMQINPHCQGTHTESISHIATALLPPHSFLPAFMPATLITIDPTAARDGDESYMPAFNANDMVISESALRAKLQKTNGKWLQALVLRTQPNELDKKTQAWQSAPFFTREAMSYLRERGVMHLLVDFPSIDRMDDGGHLTAHHMFWRVKEGGHEASPFSLKTASVSELIYVANEIEDGQYLLNLQVPALEADVAPSRPVLLPLEKC